MPKRKVLAILATFIFGVVFILSYFPLLEALNNKNPEYDEGQIQKTTFLVQSDIVIKNSPDTATKLKRFFQKASDNEKADLESRLLIMNKLFGEVQRVIKITENKTADSLYRFIINNSDICLQDPLGLRFTDSEIDFSKKIGILVLKRDERLLFSHLRKQMTKPIVYDSLNNCLLIRDDSLFSPQAKAISLLCQIYHCRCSKKDFSLLSVAEFHNDIWRGLMGLQYSVLVEKEANQLKKFIEASGGKLGVTYIRKSLYCSELSDYIGEPFSEQEFKERENKLYVFATLDMLARFYKKKDLTKIKQDFVKRYF